MAQVEYELQKNTQLIAESKGDLGGNLRDTLHIKAVIDVLDYDALDLAQCLGRQWDDQQTMRHAVELYCHQFTYSAHLPSQCMPILTAGTSLNR